MKHTSFRHRVILATFLHCLISKDNMASANEKIATATAAEKGLDTVVVTCLVDNLQVRGLISKSPKNAIVSVTFAERGFDMTVVVKDQGKETTWRKVVKKLPGEIKKADCTWKVEKGKVIITLLKAGDSSWAVQLSSRGLEQCEDEDE